MVPNSELRAIVGPDSRDDQPAGNGRSEICPGFFSELGKPAWKIGFFCL